MTHTWLKHPDTGGVWACPDDAVAVSKRRGWEDTDAPVEEDADVEAFDPVQHTVTEVVEYLEAWQEVPAEVERVVAAERSGKNRKTITGD